MKKKVIALVLACCMTMSLVACGGSSEATSEPAAETKTETAQAETKTEEAAPAADAAADPTNGEVVDGKFVETRKITVEVYDRGNDGGSDPTNNMYTEYI